MLGRVSVTSIVRGVQFEPGSTVYVPRNTRHHSNVPLDQHPKNSLLHTYRSAPLWQFAEGIQAVHSMSCPWPMLPLLTSNNVFELAMCDGCCCAIGMNACGGVTKLEQHVLHVVPVCGGCRRMMTDIIPVIPHHY